MSVSIYHNPRCSKSRQTLELLRDNGIEPEIILYLESTPSAKQLKEVIGKLGIEPEQLIRYKENVARELKLSKSDKRTATEWIKILQESPVLIERPIVISGDRAIIGRPPENVLEII